VAELVDALDLGSSGATRESSSLSFRTIRARRVACRDVAFAAYPRHHVRPFPPGRRTQASDCVTFQE
jgi:hypothetical protein